VVSGWSCIKVEQVKLASYVLELYVLCTRLRAANEAVYGILLGILNAKDSTLDSQNPEVNSPDVTFSYTINGILLDFPAHYLAPCL
jgi:hypothetical protein